ncbi:MAG: dienelactone hydrolase family protein [Saprospiraceae bacterium]|jgi:carboxymethylenebutenolidase|nr:dienelactone hydrolase family protein [Saprospiraceae bacterium]
MIKFRLFTLFCLAAFLWNCANTDSTAKESKSDNMAQFANDEKFKDAHEEPSPTELSSSGSMIEFDTPDGQTGSAFAILPSGETKSYLFVIHEWWGLNDNIKQEAQKYADSLDNVAILALDIYDGKVADNPDDAGQLMQGIQEDRAKAIINGALTYAGDDAKVATIGWCFGGGWSLKSSIIAGDKAAGCVMYYGMPVQEKEAIAPLKADILGIFAENDGWITPEVVTNFETMAKDAGKVITVHQYDADHAFANPSSPRYLKEAAQDANSKALAFLRTKL